MNLAFDDCLSKFRDFLKANGYPEDVVWVEPEDVLLSGGRLIYVRVPVADTNERRVRRLCDLSRETNKGILFETICLTVNTTYAFAWVPSNEREADLRLMPNDLKMSAKTGLAKVPGHPVRNRFRWAYLRWALATQQAHRDQLFC
jgi:hypothetical protein